MAFASLAVDWRHCDTELTRLHALLSSLSSLPPGHRKLVAEIVMIRLFLLVENTVASVCGKMLCGAMYLDGTTPQKVVDARSIKHSYDLMRNHGRATVKLNLKWSKSVDIRDNVATTLVSGDPFFLLVANNGTLLTDMRYVRNHIAHKNKGTRTNFQKVIRKRFGGLKPGLTPGGLLLSPAPPGTSSVLASYTTSCKVFLKLLVRA